jgi:1-acyl-sn-glycerol-3-phosphate acyltransferase
VVGAEEQAPALFDFKAAAKLIGFPSLPVTLTGIPLPLPVKYHLWFGEPMTFAGTAEDDDAELDRKVREVKAAIEALVAKGLAQRRGIF